MFRACVPRRRSLLFAAAIAAVTFSPMSTASVIPTGDVIYYPFFEPESFEPLPESQEGFEFPADTVIEIVDGTVTLSNGSQLFAGVLRSNNETDVWTVTGVESFIQLAFPGPRLDIRGQFLVLDGGVVDAAQPCQGSTCRSIFTDATVLVQGAGSSLDVTELFLGSSALPTNNTRVDIESGGRITVATDLHVASDADNTALIVLTAGELTVQGSTSIGNGDGSDGTLQLLNESQFVTGALTGASGGVGTDGARSRATISVLQDSTFFVNGGVDIGSGDGSVGQMSVARGNAVVSGDVTLGAGTGSEVDWFVIDGGTLATGDFSLATGTNSLGDFLVQNGSAAFIEGGLSIATGTGSATLLAVQGDSSLDVADGLRHLGDGSTASINVTGSESVLRAGSVELAAGSDATASLIAFSQGVFLVDSMELAAGSGSSATLSIQDTSATIGNVLVMAAGENANSDLQLQGVLSIGGEASPGTMQVASGAGSQFRLIMNTSSEIRLDGTVRGAEGDGSRMEILMFGIGGAPDSQQTAMRMFDFDFGSGAEAFVDIRARGGAILETAGNAALGTGAGARADILIWDRARLQIGGDFTIGGTGPGTANNNVFEIYDDGHLTVAGALNLRNANLFVEGPSTVSADTITIGQNGIFQGSGVVDTTQMTVGAGGVLRPSGPVAATLTVLGDVVVDGGLLIFRINNDATHERLEIDGDLNLLAGGIEVLPQLGFTPTAGQTFNLIEATGALTVGENFNFIYNGPGPDFEFQIAQQNGISIGSLSFLGLNLIEELVNVPGLRPNQLRMAAALDDLCPRVEALTNPTPGEIDLDRICGNLRNIGNTNAQIIAGIDALSPEEIVGTVNSLLRFTVLQHGNLGQRINGLRSGVKRIDLSALNLRFGDHVIAGRDLQNLVERLGGGASADDDFARWGLFGNGAYNHGDKNRTLNEPGYDFRGATMTFGADYRVRNNLFVGAAFGYNDLTSDFAPGGGMDQKASTLSAFGTYLWRDAGYVDVLATYGTSRSDIRRRINYEDAGGAVDRVARSRPDGTQFVAGLGTGYDFAPGSWIVGPHAGINYIDVRVDGFDEYRANGASLRIDQQTVKSLTANAGVHVSRTFLPSFGVLVPHARLDYIREFKDDPTTVGVRFVHDRFQDDPTNPTLPVGIQSDAPDSGYWMWSIGASAQMINGVAAFVNYRGSAGLRAMQLGEVTMGLRFERSF
jgi:uncharacterized protein YhjY with autotransporter beta-barrel domain